MLSGAISETNTRRERKIMITLRTNQWRNWLNFTAGTVTALVTVLALATASPAMAAKEGLGGKRAFKTYTANAYIGGDIARVVAVDPANTMELLIATTTTFAEIVASDPPARMAGIAAQIAAEMPDVLGLEELYTVMTAPVGGLSPDGSPIPGTFTVAYDYLSLVTNALAVQGAHYRVAVVATESDVTLPLIESMDPFQLHFGRIVDHEAILVRTDLPPGHLMVSKPMSGTFENRIQFPEVEIDLLRGWCSVEVFTRGERFRFICTHLEDETSPVIQKLQAAELLAGPANTKEPVMIVGDFNADPLRRNGTDTYGDIIAAGFKDAWLTVHPNDPAGGLTWGHDAQLANPADLFEWRLDFVFYRKGNLKASEAEVIDASLDRTAPPLWPTDHGTLSVSFDIRK